MITNIGVNMFKYRCKHVIKHVNTHVCKHVFEHVKMFGVKTCV